MTDSLAAAKSMTLPDWAPGLLAAAAAFLVLARGLWGGFVDMDDFRVIADNPLVMGGLSVENVLGAFSLNTPSYFQPLTWISLQATASLVGTSPAAFILCNILLKAASVWLVHDLLRRATGREYAAFFAALLWGVHPIGVEAVVWASQRKEALAVFFLLATMRAYVASPKPGQAVWALGCAALLSKPTAIVLPALLLLTDFWPLGRIRNAEDAARSLRALWPLWTAAGLVALLVFASHAPASLSEETHPPVELVKNALLTPFFSIKDLFFPFDLTPLVPFPEHSPLWAAVLALAGLLGISLALWRLQDRAPYAFFGWMCFLVCLVPTLKLHSFGLWYGRADRFAHLAALGLAVALVYGLYAALAKRPALAKPVLGLALACCVLLAGLSVRQTGFWRDSETLFRRALAVHPDNIDATGALAAALAQAGRLPEAKRLLTDLLAKHPGDVDAKVNLAGILLAENRPAEALDLLADALEKRPKSVAVILNIGVALGRMGDHAGAKRAFLAVLDLKPGLVAAEQGLAAAEQGLSAGPAATAKP